MYWHVIGNVGEAAWPAAVALGAALLVLLFTALPRRKLAAISPILASALTFTISSILAAWPASRNTLTADLVLIGGLVATIAFIPRSVLDLRNSWVGIIHLLTLAATAYLRFMEEMTAEWAEECWKAILEVLARHPPDQVLGGLAAGPLEELINEQGPLFIQRIELLARRDPAFRNLLRGVWQSSTPDVWKRVEKARGDGSVP